MNKNPRNCFLLLLICSLIIHAISAANDTIDTSQSIKDGETLVSSDEMFELGFFSLGNSGNRYLGIWYKNIPDRVYVWVANRKVPLTTKSGVLKVTESGNLALFNDTNGIMVWSSNTTRSPGINPVALLLGSGNLVVKDANDDRTENFIWQSFDYPSDSLLPGMSMGWNLVTGEETYYTSWRSDDDPSLGEFTAHLDPTGYPQLFVKRVDVIQARIGPWNGVLFSGAPGTRTNPTLRMNKNEVKYREDSVEESLVTLLKLSPDGVGQRWTWNYGTHTWTIYNTTSPDFYSYNSGGANGICSVGNSSPCGCLDKFVQKGLDLSSGCGPRTPVNCEDDGFLKYSGVKLPDARYASFNDQRMFLEDCKAECSRNCSCVAYTQLDIREEASGCLFYHGDLIDMRFVAQDGQDLYIRVASSEIENVADSKGKKRIIIVVSSVSIAAMILVCLTVFIICTHKRKKNSNLGRKGAFMESNGKETDLPFFDLSTILKATDHFSHSNKLGEGGFGPVYKGMLEDGREIAVKRLSETSSQGVDEFKNEVVLIAKLQHRNLVRLLGCCIQGEENMLIYEYLPNNSLDSILFHQTKSTMLDWRQRFHIINGIAKGLLYLHQDSRLRIIHRDLKASNILLDADMNPKISDFGLARGFGENEIEAKTRRVVGTYGYMSPEYAIDGLFSVKSDVFSFGILVLEIVCGKKNRGLFISDNNLNLLGYAWTLHKADKSYELVDTSLGDSFDISEALRSIHVGLLCVQAGPEDRPSMSSVVFMLGNEVALPEPKQPAFFGETHSVVRSSASSSENRVTITLPQGR
ncbi:hypothetical protein ACS0TY_016999 [Phlomoides rotata]